MTDAPVRPIPTHTQTYISKADAGSEWLPSDVYEVYSRAQDDLANWDLSTSNDSLKDDRNGPYDRARHEEMDADLTEIGKSIETIKKYDTCSAAPAPYPVDSAEGCKQAVRVLYMTQRRRLDRPSRTCRPGSDGTTSQRDWRLTASGLYGSGCPRPTKCVHASINDICLLRAFNVACSLRDCLLRTCGTGPPCSSRQRLDILSAASEKVQAIHMPI